jgi:hypothetical protein
MRRLFFVLVCGIPALAQTSSNAVTSLAFGPQQFNRSPGAPVPVRMTFTIPPLVDGPFTVIVQNGSPAVNAGRITVNGVRVIDSEDLHQTTYQVPVTLASSNIIEVELRGAPGGSVTVSVAGYSYAFASDYSSIPLYGALGSDDIDWRTKGSVTPVKNEGMCQDDWAFSATGVVEGATQIQSGRLSSLSEQQLLDCTPPSLNLPASCTDSSPAGALKNVIANFSGGMTSEANYPYTARMGSCKAFTPVTAIGSLTWSTGSEAGLEAQVEQQPVSVVFNGNWLSTYTYGIANTSSCGAQPPQYVAGLVVGSINGGPTPYWIVKLSMGTIFGIQGYVDIPKGSNCGLGNYALTAHLAD